MKLFKKYKKEHKKKPLLSIILVVYDMPDQALNTLFTLSDNYQQGVCVNDYEILVVENLSNNNLDQTSVSSVASNAKYIPRNEKKSTPVFAINAAAKQAQAEHIAIIIDGARLLTPGIVKSTLDAIRITSDAVVTVPGYHLGQEPQQYAVKTGYNEVTEKQLLDSIQWPSNGYKLFSIACMSGSSSQHGILQKIPEANFIALSKKLFLRLGGYDQRFNSHGGGYANLDFFKRVCEDKNSILYSLICEGTFHQYHGGSTTGGDNGNRDLLMSTLLEQYQSIRKCGYSPPNKKFNLLGDFRREPASFLVESLKKLND
jgi:hypothetical protein